MTQQSAITKTEAEPTDLVVNIRGEIVESNFEAFRIHLKKKISGLNRTLVTDRDFTEADTNVKQLKETESALKEAKTRALAQAEDIQRLFEAIDDVTGEASRARLDLEKQIRQRKEARKLEIVEEALAEVNAVLKRQARERLEAVIKGKRSFDTMEAAAREERNAINFIIAQARGIIDKHRQEHGQALTPDIEKLEWMEPDQLATELARRVERAEAEAARKKAEDEARALREQQAAEARAKAEAERNAKPPEQDIPTQQGEQAPTTSNTAPIAGRNPVAQSPVRAEFSASGQTPSQQEEMQQFAATLLQCLAPVKAARARLTYAENQKRAEVFAQKLNQAFKELKGGAS